MKSMKKIEMNDEAIQKLLEFERLKLESYSPNWDIDLEKKMKSTQTTSFYSLNGYSLLLLFLISINIGVFYMSANAKNEATTSRVAVLKTISNELLMP